MSARTVLFLGGPKDGDVMALPGDHWNVSVAEMDHASLFAWGREEPISSTITQTIVRYRVERIALFGLMIHVATLEGITPEERQARAVMHLLSDTAKGLLS